MTSSNKVQLKRNVRGRKKERQKGRNKQNKVQLKRNVRGRAEIKLD